MMQWERREIASEFTRVALALFDIGATRETTPLLNREGLRALLLLAESELADRAAVKP